MDDDDANRELYTRLLREHGATPAAVNWRTSQNQHLRFAILVGVGVEYTSSVLDIGCGTGDLLEHLTRECNFSGQYAGVDITTAMIEASRTRFPGVRFENIHLLQTDKQIDDLVADFVMASGIFYHRWTKPFEYMCNVVSRMYALCRKGVAFNSLSSWADQPADGKEFRADPIATLEFCRSLTAFVALRHDYHPGDFTIYLRRPAPASD